MYGIPIKGNKNHRPNTIDEVAFIVGTMSKYIQA